MLFELTNKTAIITGASRGIGLAIARSLAHAGAKTYLVARTPETLHAACKHINDDIDIDTNTTTTTTTSAPTRHPAIPVPGDVSRPQTWDALLAHTDTVEPHLLVNAAGIAQTALLHKTSPDAIDALLHANLRSTILGCRAVGRHMMRRPLRERRNGQLSIINVASVMATHGQTGASVYAATKAGILGKQNQNALCFVLPFFSVPFFSFFLFQYSLLI